MKRTLASILVLVLLLSAASAALATEEAYMNPEFNREEMKNIHGEMVKFEDLKNLQGHHWLGFAFLVPEFMNGFDEKSPTPRTSSDHEFGYMYLPPETLKLYLEMYEMKTEEEFNAAYKKVDEQAVYAFSVLRYNEELKGAAEAKEKFEKNFKHIELVTSNGKNQYYLGYNTSEENSQLNQEEKEFLDKFVKDGLELVRKGLILFPAQDPASMGGTEEIVELEGGVEAFAAKDLNDKPFDPAEFSKYDLTLVNVWFTGCNPCIEEMPYLQKLKEALPENVNLITVCLDGDAENEFARQVVEGVGATFTTLKGDELAKGVLKNITGTPTTLFIDRQGRQVGAAIMGAIAGLDNFVEQSMQLIYERLASIPQE